MVKTSFSSYGSAMDLAAPAEAVLSPYLAQTFARWSGTSFAAPLVSGGAALLLDRYPGLLSAEVEDLLRASAQPDPNQNGPFAGKTGNGTLDIERVTRSIAVDRNSLKLQKRSSADPGSTWVRWSPVEGAGAYDLVRGTLSALTRSGGAVHLGPVTCRSNDVAAGVVGWVAEPDVPPAGEAFFYLIRDDADETGGMSYGTGSVGEPRLPTSGDCEL
jgi:hypothetical protein